MPADGNLKCPRCASRRVVRGELVYERSPVRIRFRPMAARLAFARMGVPVDDDGYACAMCGLFWGTVSPKDLEENLSRLAGAEVRAWLDEKPEIPLE